jgi:signal transduction histidine kinase
MAFNRASPVRLMVGAVLLKAAFMLGRRSHARTRRHGARHRSTSFQEPRDRRLKDIVSIQEQERRRIARDLHDVLGQRITSLRLQVESWTCAHGSATWEQRIEDLLGHLDLIDREVDLLAWKLRPLILDHVGLVEAFDSLIREWSEAYGISAEFHANGVRARMAPDVETCLYRIAQEALHNVVKHARASHVAVILEHSADGIGLIVEDDGCGFDLAERIDAGLDRHIGITGMRERAALVRGSAEIETAPGKGTTVLVHVPAAPASPGEVDLGATRRTLDRESGDRRLIEHGSELGLYLGGMIRS